MTRRLHIKAIIIGMDKYQCIYDQKIRYRLYENVYLYEYGACNIEVACFLNSSANERLGMFLDRRRDVETQTSPAFFFLVLMETSEESCFNQSRKATVPSMCYWQ